MAIHPTGTPVGEGSVRAMYDSIDRSRSASSRGNKACTPDA